MSRKRQIQFGIEVRQARRERKLTQEQASRRAGLLQTNWSALELGKLNACLSTIEKIERVLHVKFGVK